MSEKGTSKLVRVITASRAKRAKWKAEKGEKEEPEKSEKEVKPSEGEKEDEGTKTVPETEGSSSQPTKGKKKRSGVPAQIEGVGQVVNVSAGVAPRCMGLYRRASEPQKRNITMRATIIHGAGDVRVETVPDPKILEPTDALVRVAAACICGSDLWPYRSMPASQTGARIGHEFLGVIEDVGVDVAGFAAGDLVVAPFVWSDGTCDFCHEGLQTSCRHGGLWGRDGIDGGQGEAVRVPQAAGTLVTLPVGEDSAFLPSLLTLSDVFPTGCHCARTAGVNPRTTVTVIGDGAFGLCAVLSAKRLAAERIILMGRHKDRTDLGLEFGATDIVSERGEEGIEKARELTGGNGTHTVLECVGLVEAIGTAFGVVRDGGTVSRVGAPVRRRAHAVPDVHAQCHPHWRRGPGTGPTSTLCSRTCSEGRVQPEWSSTGRLASTMSPTVTGRWRTVLLSRCSSSPDQSTRRQIPDASHQRGE